MTLLEELQAEGDKLIRGIRDTRTSERRMPDQNRIEASRAKRRDVADHQAKRGRSPRSGKLA